MLKSRGAPTEIPASVKGQPSNRSSPVDENGTWPRTWLWALALALVSFALSMWRIGEASVWTDEAATLTASTRTLPELLTLVSRTDAVHAAYYFAAHAWLQLFGADVWILRAMSAVAVAAAVFGIAMLGEAVASRRVGVAAGILLTLVPQSMWAATEGRSFAFGMALTTWTAYALVNAMRRGRWRWALYALLAATSVAVFVYSALAIVAFTLSCAVYAEWRRRLPVVLLWSGIGGIVAAPVVVLSLRQRDQVSWISPLDSSIISDVVVNQWFSGNQWFDGMLVLPHLRYIVAAAFIGLITWGIVDAARKSRGGRLIALAVPWVLLPTGVIVAVSVIGAPMYTHRYLTFSVPGVALLAGLAVARVERVWTRVGAVAALAILVAPIYISLRTEGAKYTDWAAVARVLDAHAVPGDGIYFEPEEGTLGLRSILVAYPAQTNAVIDVALVTAAAARGTLEDETIPIADTWPGADLQRLWLAVGASGSIDPKTEQWLDRHGFTQALFRQFDTSTLALFIRV